MDADYLFGAKFLDRKLIPNQINLRSRCLSIPGMAELMTDTYLSILYPIYVPVTYFQGKNDGATVARNAELHFREVAQSAANLVMIENEGHSPVVFTMTDDRLKDAFRVVFADAVTGQKIEILPTSPLSPVWSVKTNRFPQ